MITQINPCNPLIIREINAAQRRGQAIVEYVLLATVVGVAIALVVDLARTQATRVVQRELDSINLMPSH